MDKEYQHAINNHPENCKIYTPAVIAKRMVEKLDIDWNSNFKILEPAVGTGNIFLELISIYLDHTNESDDAIKYKLENSFVAFDIDETVINVLIDSLNKLVYKKKKINKVKWNIKVLNVLDIEEIDKLNSSFDYIICNPPYIHVKKLTIEQRKILKKTPTCNYGNINMYYYFLDKATSWLKEGGKFSYIVPNGILNNKSGKNLRSHLLSFGSVTSIENFPNDELFKDALVKTCIISYQKTISNKLTVYKDMEYKNGNVNVIYKTKIKINIDSFLPLIPQSNTGYQLKELFYIEGGIATFEDKFFIIKDSEITEDTLEEVLIFKKEEKQYVVEKELIRNVVRPNKDNEMSYIIFPYKKDFNQIDINQFPNFRNYYNSYKEKQSYVYGRKQSITHINNERIILPKICKKFKMLIRENCLVVSGISLVLKPEYAINRELIYQALEQNLDRIFVEATNKSKAYGSGYYNISTNALKELYIQLGE